MTKSSKLGLGCIILFLVLIGCGVAGLLVDLVKSIREAEADRNAQIAPFAAHLSEYTEFTLKHRHELPYNEQSPFTVVTGKAIIIDKTTNTIDYTYYGLPPDLKASNPEEVGTVVWISCSETVVGRYVSGAKGYQWRCDVTVIDKATAFVIGSSDVSSLGPPGAKDHRGDWHGPKPPSSKLLEHVIKQLRFFSIREG